MIDLHSHILPGIDDGSSSIEESLDILKKAAHYGVEKLVLTPHFIYGSRYNVNNSDKEKKLSLLKRTIKKEKLSLELYLGNEVFIDQDALTFFKNDQITTLAGSHYLLFELPMCNSYSGLQDFIFQLQSRGFQLILAHPERYVLFQKDPTLMLPLLESGVLFQSNIGSFFGYYGNEAKKLVFLLLKHHAISFISSDTHHAKDPFYENLDTLKQILLKYVDSLEIERMLIGNAKLVLADRKVKSVEILPFHKNWLGKWK